MLKYRGIQILCNPISVQKYIPLFYLIGMCPLVIKCDLEYWGLDELLLEPCCALKYYPEVEICVKEIQSDEIAFKKTKVSEIMSCKESKKNVYICRYVPLTKMWQKHWVNNFIYTLRYALLGSYYTCWSATYCWYCLGNFHLYFWNMCTTPSSFFYYMKNLKSQKLHNPPNTKWGL